jgi:photosystem II stability/assembly factor-like uncharacterized protein
VSEVFKSEDDGATWSQLSTGLRDASHQWIFSVTVPPEDSRTAFVTTAGAGVFKTTDAGRSWTESNRWLPNSATRDLITEPGNPRTLYVAMAQSGGVGKSLDGGDHWSQTGLDDVYVVQLAMDRFSPSTVYAAVRDSTLATAGLYKTTDGGVTWTRTLATVSAEEVLIDPYDSNIVYVGALPQGVFKSTDAGHTFTPMNSGLTATMIRTLQIDPTDSNVVYAGTQDGGVFKSIDGAASWSFTGLAGNISGIVVDPQHPNRVYVGGIAIGVYASVDGGASWIAINRGLPATLVVTSFSADPSNVNTLYAGTQDNGVFVSHDHGNNWWH